jgi:cellulose synthase/poly-beta-1,6-N-acetylglucosamine synthase-like glycosyltransferase
MIMKKPIQIRLVNYRLAKCSKCNDELKLDQKSIRYQNKWFHANCFKSTLQKTELAPKLIRQAAHEKNEKIYKTNVISERIYRPPLKRSEIPPQSTQSHASLEMLEKVTAELKVLKQVTSKPVEQPKPLEPPQKPPEKRKKPTTRIKPDPVLVALAVAVFALLIYNVYSISTYLSVLSIALAATIAFYHILSRRPPQTQYQYGSRAASAYSMIILVLPFIFGTIIAFEGYPAYVTLTQAIFVWSLTLSFWQTMLFVPLAIRSAAREAMLEEPTTWPRISVIVPAYNEENVIRLTIESLLATDYPDKEIIIVDDGSKDKTLEIAMEYKDKIKLIHKENGGKASALNQGLLYATGEIVTIVDADTIIGHSSLRHIAKAMAEENVAAVAGNVKIRNKVNWLTWCQALEYMSGIQIMRRGLDYFGAITIVPGALGAFRKKKLIEAGTYHKDTLVEDFDATMKVLRSGMIVSGSSAATAYTQAPQTLRDYYRQRKRWYRGNLQVLRRHSDVLLNPRFGYLQKLSYPLMAIHMLVIPIASIMLWSLVAYQLIIGQYQFVGFTLGIYITLQYLLSAMAIRMDNDDKRMILYSVFLVIGYKQIMDVLQIKAVIEEILGKKAKWTSAERVKQ